MNTYVYVDGFNLYYGALRKTPYRWLSLMSLCQKLLHQNDILKIKYFTARIGARPDDPNRDIRQQVYLKALKTIPECEIILGHFLTHNVNMPLSTPPPMGSRMVQVIKTEEKGSDVNLASHLLLDGFKGLYDVAVIISNDSDLLTPLKMVKNELGKRVGLITPYNKPSRVLKQEADFWLRIPKHHLRDSQFPDQITHGNTVITKPDLW